MALRVLSEIGRLRRVLIHRPGHEVDWMVPSLMERLLFDDILDGEQARREHDEFVGVLKAAGVEPLDPQDLLSEVLGNSVARDQLLDRLRTQGEPQKTLEAMAESSADELALGLIQGLRTHESGPVERLRTFYQLAPVPNYFFQRDPQVVLGDRVLLSAMATEARRREPLLAETIFTHHPALAGAADQIHLKPPADIHSQQVPKLEGGDILIPSPDLLLIGLSERTNRRGVEALIDYLRNHETTFEQMILVELPAKRSYMHLDTVFTFLDQQRCLAYTPVIKGDGAEAGHVYRIDLRLDRLSYTFCTDLPSALEEAGHPVELVPCGGGESVIDQQREQWTDGANVFALAPGVITIYRRNRRTIEELDRRGFRVITGEDVVAGHEEVLGHGPTVVTLLSNELSRARGGPRCMTMPLERDVVV